MKQFITILTLIALAATALFWQQVWSIFVGMTVLESLEMIVQFILHVAVGTIVVYGVATAPELIKPWMRAFRQKQRQARRGRTVVQVKTTEKKPRRLTVDELLTVLAPTKKIQKMPVQMPDDHVDLNL
jgi:hypothetical protein